MCAVVALPKLTKYFVPDLMSADLAFEAFAESLKADPPAKRCILVTAEPAAGKTVSATQFFVTLA